MKAKAVFAGKARLRIKWSGTTMPKLEKEFDELLRPYGLEFYGSGYEYATRERTLVYGPIEDESSTDGEKAT